MRQFAVLLLLVAICGCDQLKPTKAAAQAQAPSAQAPSPSPEVGRYTIVHSPHVQSDTMLLDTVTGQTWQLDQFRDLKGEPLAWERVRRLDSPDDYQAMVTAYGSKEKGTTP